MAETGLEPGVRCIRGPDWKWDNQDGGPGHAGTVVELGAPDNPYLLPGSVKVIWDNGFSNNYHAGRSNLYDLRVLDNSPAGSIHRNILCGGCSQPEIFGIRWSCNQCLGINLCSRCYHLKFHDLTHEFTRYVEPGGPGVKVPCRAAAQQTEVFGIFRGAVVMRGPDWEWGDQDGGVGTQGLVREITNWKNETGNSVASVVWRGNKENLYRLGHKNKVDIRYVKSGSGGKVFYNHLPLLGKSIDKCQTFHLGQTVEVCVDLATFKQLQIGHGEFREEMSQLVGKKGRVHRFTEKGDVRVQFQGTGDTSSFRFTVNPMALRLVRKFETGDQVKITEDRSVISRFHTNHAALSGYAGCNARVQHVQSDSSVTVDIGNGRVVSVHPAILLHVDPPTQFTKPEPNLNERFITLACSGDVHQVEKILNNQEAVPDNEALLAGMHKSAELGLLVIVATILKFRPVLVNQMLQGKTVLMIAAYQGYVDMLNLLLQSGGDGFIPDQVGDLPIHYAALGSKPEAVLILADKGSQVNVKNNEERTPLHQAVIGRSMETLTALLKVGAAVNVQDKNGETPLQIAINIKFEEGASAMVDQADILVFEKNGWNSLHLAVRSGLVGVVAQLLSADRRCINIVTRDGQAPLHIAVSSGNLSMVRCLLETAECDINIQDAQGRTALHYASLAANLALINLILSHRCDIDVQDCEGNTAAHLSMLGSSHVAEESQYKNELEAILDPMHIDRLTQLQVPSSQILRVGVLLTLLQNGADRSIVNSSGEPPLHLVQNPQVESFILEYLVRPAAAQPVGAEHDYAEIQDPGRDDTIIPGAVADAETPDPGNFPSLTDVEQECRICCEKSQLVTFIPCQHNITCHDCSVRMKKCLQCNSIIQSKILQQPSNDKKEFHRLHSLERKVQDLEEQFLCGICMERKRNVAFLCGHGACQICTQGLVNCHMCRNKIEKKIPLY